MTETITLDRVRKVAREVAERYPHRIQNACEYLVEYDNEAPKGSAEVVTNGEVRYVGCIAAQVFHRIDPRINAELYYHGAGAILDPLRTGGARPHDFSAAGVLGRYGFTSMAISYLSRLQHRSDRRDQWGMAFAAVEAQS